MALNSYLQLTQLLLKDPKQERFNLFDLKTYINIARSQIASEGECIKVIGTIPTVNGQQAYSFPNIIISSVPGAASVLTCRQIASGGVLLIPRPWEWFFAYYIATPSASATPQIWSQFGRGTSGNFYLQPTPSGIATLSIDTICLPAALVDDTTAEAIPYPYTDAIPYYSAYMALLTDGDPQGAQSMYEVYERFMYRAVAQSTPSVLPDYSIGGEGARLSGMRQPIVNPQTIGGSGGNRQQR